ncbi:hypothetical protein RIF29_23321 [Crotalaria pallida]|uniref:Uncharacterized protein n=1 Tax=Crotalaria pallida TaxID=3830 RepID=A0AAN9F844_CROPI
MSATAKQQEEEASKEQQQSSSTSCSWKSKREVLERLFYLDKKEGTGPIFWYLVAEGPCKGAFHDFMECMDKVFYNKGSNSISDGEVICDSPLTAFQNCINDHPQSKQHVFDDDAPPPASWDQCCIQ